MTKKIGAVLARTFRDVCEDSNSRARADYSTISSQEIKELEDLLKNVDNTAFDLQAALKRYLKVED